MSKATIPISAESLTGEVKKRFYAKTERVDNGCLRWTGASSRLGYGRFKLNGNMVLAHRVSFAIANGGLSTVGVIDHLCRNAWCIEPSHLEQISQAMNTARGTNHVGVRIRQREKTGACPQGHPTNDENWRFLGGQFRCIPCDKAGSAEWEKRPYVRERKAARMREYRARKKREAAGEVRD